MSDCTPFTSSGYVGEDVDVCVKRLLVEANYDIAAAEHGIICLDEIDKIAGVKPVHGKDIGGEGVQQALLKIIEGTTVYIPANPERSSGGRSPGNASGTSDGQIGSRDSKEPLKVRTDNILFVCTGAFAGLHKTISTRVFQAGMGFGAKVRSSSSESSVHETQIQGEEAVFRKHLPYYVPPEPKPTSGGDPFSSPPARLRTQQKPYNILDLVQAEDLQKYGMIPELLGRIGTYCAVHALDEEALVRVLTEPKNSLVREYEWTLGASGVELRFTSSALRAVAHSASGMGTGARGLRTVLERILGDAMHETPGMFLVQSTSPVHVLLS
jgi:ATP-dependent Clp protease ATP-binding subunit ClpX